MGNITSRLTFERAMIESLALHAPAANTRQGRLAAFVLLAFLAACGGGADGGGLAPRDTTVTAGPAMHLMYDEFLPAAYGADTTVKWPLILSLHGAGGLLKEDNLIEVRAKREAGFPFIVLAPRSSNGWSTPLLDDLLVNAGKRLRIDPDRIYVTGLSMGAYGAWALVVAYPHRFAALALVAGGGVVSDACTLKHLPLWAFHNRADPVVPVTESESIVAAVRQCNGVANLTIYDQLAPNQWAHNAWQSAWTTPELYQWFLQLRRTP
jgi:predicted peptidase